MMNRIEEKMAALKQCGKKAFITYMTAGLPDLEKTKELVFAQEQAGIDVIELGIPFSDPVADGPVIQNASYESIQNGTTLVKVFSLMQEIRKSGSNVPIVFMMYYNTVFHYGIKDFAEQCASCGVDGLIIPDLPYEEQQELQEALNEKEGAPILIQLVSPVSKQRIPMILEHARGFVYCVSQMGVTGGSAQFHKNIREYLSEVKKAANIPVMMGFGIRTADDVKPLSDIIDGAVVGSHFINLLRKSNYDSGEVQKYIKEFKMQLNME